MRGIPVAYRAPFAIGQQCYVDERPSGDSILEIVLSVPNLPLRFFDRGFVHINGEMIPRDMWAYVRPKPTSTECPIAVTLHFPLAGGGGGGGGGSTAKSVIGIVAALALVVITAGIATGALIPAAALGALTQPLIFGITGAQILAGAVGIAGALAISALTAPPTAAQQSSVTGPTDVSDTNTDNKESASASGNILDRGGAIPRIVGTRKVFPPLACYPIVELVDDEEYAEAIFVLNGPHLLEDIRIEGASVDESEDIDIETREGWEGDELLTKFNRQGRMITPQIELSIHKVNPAAQQQILTQSDPRKSCPLWHSTTARNDPDEIWLHIPFPQGISFQAGTTQIGVPFRLRMRRIGTDDWINFPEFHVAGASIQALRKAVLIKWKNSEPIQPVPASDGFVFAGGQIDLTAVDPDITHQDSNWQAHSNFLQAGSTFLYAGAETTSAVKNTNLFANRIEFYINESLIQKGQYELQLKRGSHYTRSSFTPSTYIYSGSLINFFTWFVSGGVALIAGDRTNIADRVGIARNVSIWNEYPIATKGFATIAVRARNRSIQQISVRASGYVRDWDGSAWANWTTTSNPAPHYVDILSGMQNIDPLPDDLRDDATLVDWRTHCQNFGFEVNSIINDMRTQDALQQVASWGYARPYQSDQYSVVIDRDRTGEVPVQVFSRRNATNVRIEMAFPRLPAGFNVSYRDDAQDDDQAQLTVYREDLSNADLTLLEAVTYEGNTNIEQVRTRAQFDINQATARNVFYYLDADIESIVCRRGNLVALQHDILTARAGDGYISSIQRDSGSPSSTITGVTLDSDIPFGSFVDMHGVTDMHLVDDMHELGRLTGIVIRHTDGTLSSHQIASIAGNALTFTTPIAFDSTIQSYEDNDHKYGCMVVAGDLNSEYRRLIVHSISPTQDLKASLVLVDEAPSLFVPFAAPLLAEDGATELESESGDTLFPE